MYLVVWDDGGVSKLQSNILPDNLLEANANSEVCIIRHSTSQGFERLDEDNETWTDFPDYGLSWLANNGACKEDEDDEDDDSWQDEDDE